ncbi:hypothetical protein LGR54_13660 [Ancylobacter sp. Lp-2]|uniref:hypothetical protein n=1 Tax=Ancylobacter sp. Lp-2 TaxID=2881339 RepID=UPI001E2FD707|nr:hypothetical protein [Ancylobacter sp. Lp-2]MCB4769658.1 hypothetical protein [Ancylobacter sp. Lp-2]
MNVHRTRPCAAIVFGAIRDPAVAARHTLADLRQSGLGLGQGAALVSAGSPALRLNSRGWFALRPQEAAELGAHADRVGFCAARLRTSVPLFAGALRPFLENYIAFLQQRIQLDRDALEAKLEAVGLPVAGGMLDYRDWIYSGFLPLPNAHVLLAEADADAEPAFAHIDCAFWTGQTLVAVLFDSHNMPLPSERRALERLEAEFPDVEIVRIPATRRGEPAALTGRLGELLAGFAADVTLPYGLFRADAAFAAGL